MLYGALAGFTLFVLFAGWIFAHIDWDSHVGSPVVHLFPEGTQIIEERDSHGGFHGDGVAFLAAQIPQSSSEEFALLLQERKVLKLLIWWQGSVRLIWMHPRK